VLPFLNFSPGIDQDAKSKSILLHRIASKLPRLTPVKSDSRKKSRSDGDSCARDASSLASSLGVDGGQKAQVFGRQRSVSRLLSMPANQPSIKHPWSRSSQWCRRQS